MMPARHRVRDGRFSISGSCTTLAGDPIASDSATVGKHETCDDFVGNMEGDNEFTLLIQENRRWVLEGKYTRSTGTTVIYDGMPIYGGWLVPPSLGSIAPALSALELNNLALQALADLNPSTPHVSVPQALGELKDLPSLVRDWGGDLLKKVAKGHLSWRWAIKPMISDIRKLLSFHDAVNQRMKWLERLRDGKELKRRTSLGSYFDNTAWTVGAILHSKSGTVVRGNTRIERTVKQWATVRYKVNESAVIPTDYSDRLSYARRLVTGMTSHNAMATAWELMPWSWLIDWFTGVGDAIAIQDNSIGLDHSAVCIMRTSVSKQVRRITSPPEFASLAKGAHFEGRTKKERHVVSPIFPFQIRFPLLDRGKWSILGSLAVLRRK